jgi:hypothetical protein
VVEDNGVAASAFNSLDDYARARAEQYENICRKDFSVSESLAVAETLETLEREAARASGCSRETARKAAKSSDNSLSKSTTVVDDCQPSDDGSSFRHSSTAFAQILSGTKDSRPAARNSATLV